MGGGEGVKRRRRKGRGRRRRRSEQEKGKEEREREEKKHSDLWTIIPQYMALACTKPWNLIGHTEIFNASPRIQTWD